MNILKSVLRLVTGCAHHDMYRERRQLHGVDVLHLVCHDCGHAVTAIQRTADEHAAIVRAGAVRVLQARPALIRNLRRTA
jgi:hypothetical protein